MSALSTDLEPLLDELRAALEELYGERLVRLVLYGSQARGDVHEESDVDVLVVLEGPVEPGREIRQMGEVRTRIGIEHEKALSLLPVSEADYQQGASAWLLNIRKEGQRL